MIGYIRLYRGWRDCEVFCDEPMTEREAWVWLLEKAVWKACVRRNAKGERITLERGQYHTSLRTLAEQWGWSKNKVDRFLARLVEAEMIGTVAGQSGIIITICNYEKYQEARDSLESETGTVAGQSRDTQEEGKEILPTVAKATSGKRGKSDFVLPDWVPKTDWDAFVEMRAKIRKALTEHAKGLAVDELRKLKEMGWGSGVVLRHCTLNGYQGIFPPRGEPKGDGYSAKPSEMPATARADLLRKAIRNYENLGRDAETDAWRKELTELERAA